MRCTNEEESIVPIGPGPSAVMNLERPRAVSVNSPPSFRCESVTFKESSQSSDFSRSGSEAGFYMRINCQNLLLKAQSLKKSNPFNDDDAFLLQSEESEHSTEPTTGELSWNRTRSNVLPISTKISLTKEKNHKVAKAMKYVQNLSSLFETIELVRPPFELPRNVCFYKAVHELDGNTYVVKKTKFFVRNDDKLKHHPAYQQIAEVKQPRNWTDIRYVNSWVELDQDSGGEAGQTTDGLHLLLCIQMRYTKDLTKLAKDLLIFSGREDLDEDTVYDIAEDTLDKVDQHQTLSRKEALINSFAEIGYDPAATPNGLELQTWKICFEDALEA